MSLLVFFIEYNHFQLCKEIYQRYEIPQTEAPQNYRTFANFILKNTSKTLNLRLGKKIKIDADHLMLSVIQFLMIHL